MKKIDLTGRRFGKLFVIKDIGSKQEGKRKYRWWLCKCDCGKFTKIRAGHLIGGQTGCGCGQKLPEGESQFNQVFYNYKKQAEQRGFNFDLTKEQFRNLLFSNCFYCGAVSNAVKKAKKANGCCVYTGIDRVNNSKGYVIDNCVSCCKICNRMKHTLSKDKFLQHIKKIYVVNSVE